MMDLVSGWQIDYLQLIFIVSVIISTIIIYFVTKLFGEKEGIKQAFIASYYWGNRLYYSVC